MSSDPNKQGQYPPPQWDSAPQRGAPYPAQPPYPAQHQNNYRVHLTTTLVVARSRLLILLQGPPPQGYGSSPSTPGEMVTLPPPQHQQHPHPGMYPPHDMYAQYPPDPRGPPPPHMQYQAQPAPRQRTAIACRYCRRRKVRLTAGTTCVADTDPMTDSLLGI